MREYFVAIVFIIIVGSLHKVMDETDTMSSYNYHVFIEICRFLNHFNII